MSRYLFVFCFLLLFSPKQQAFGQTNMGLKSAVPVRIEFTSNFAPYPAQFATLEIYASVVQRHPMAKVGDAFVFEGDLLVNASYPMNIHTGYNTGCDETSYSEYLASRSGIRARQVTINGSIITNDFLFDNFHDGANIVFKVSSTGQVSPGTGTVFEFDERIPAEVSATKETRWDTVMDYNTHVNAWYSVIHNDNMSDESKVEIAYFRLYARMNTGDDILLASDEFEAVWGGGLYYRYPYFACPITHFSDMPAELLNGKLVFFPGLHKDRVWHGWCTGPWPAKPSGTIGFWVEARVLISGPAVMQLGVDIRNNPSSHSEYGLSNWYFESENWQVIYFNKPPVTNMLYLQDVHLQPGESFCYNAYECINVAGGTHGFTIQNGARATMISGQRIVLNPETRVYPGGYLHAYITQYDDYCIPIAKSEPDAMITSVDIPEICKETAFFKVFPNPTSGSFTLELGDWLNADGVSVEIYNTLGSRVIQVTLPPEQQHALNIADQQPGIYVIRVLTGDRVGVERIVMR